MNTLPLTVKRALELLGLVLAAIIIVAGKVIIMPLLFALFISVAILPLTKLFIKWKIPEPISIFLCILLLGCVAGLLIWLFYSQVNFLLDDYSTIQSNITKHLTTVGTWVNKTFGYSTSEQSRFFQQQSNKVLSSAGNYIKPAAGSISGVFLFFGLLPIYIYFILYYRSILLQFLLMWVQPKNHNRVEDIVSKTQHVTQRYLVGLVIQIGYLIILLWLLLMLFGISHALLIAILFAFLNLIPYLGALVGNILGILITLATSDHITDIIIVLAVIAVVQFLDNNILMPRIVGSQVKINALVSIVGLLAGGLLAGIPGMFLAMPVMAILRVIFDETTQFKKWAVLLGDKRPT